VFFRDLSTVVRTTKSRPALLFAGQLSSAHHRSSGSPSERRAGVGHLVVSTGDRPSLVCAEGAAELYR